MPNRARKNVMRGSQKRTNIELLKGAIKTLFRGGSPVLPPELHEPIKRGIRGIIKRGLRKGGRLGR